MFKYIALPTFEKSFKKLDLRTQLFIKAWIVNNLTNVQDPTAISSYKELKGNYKGVARYRIGNYRLIVKINGSKLELLLVYVDKRASVYQKFGRIFKNIKNKILDEKHTDR